MITLQIVELSGADLYRTLVEDMRSGKLQTLSVAKRGQKVVHCNPRISGWMKWSPSEGVINCSILSPRKPGNEWQFLSAFLGRLADKYPQSIHSISIQFPEAASDKLISRRGRK